MSRKRRSLSGSQFSRRKNRDGKFNVKVTKAQIDGIVIKAVDVTNAIQAALLISSNYIEQESDWNYAFTVKSSDVELTPGHEASCEQGRH